MKKFAFILMGSHYDPKKHMACFETENGFTYIFTVRSFEEATDKILSLQKEGFGAVELCGAFGEAYVKKAIELTNNTLAIGYVVHRSEQDDLFEKFFSK